MEAAMKTILANGVIVFVLTGCAMFHSTSTHNQVEREIRAQAAVELKRLEGLFNHRLQVVAYKESITYDYDLSSVQYFLRDPKYNLCYVLTISHHKHFLDLDSCESKTFADKRSID
jgi:hypothetical protein